MASYQLAYSLDAPRNVLYSLCELPADLLALVEAQLDSDAPGRPLVIKGQADDDAVLCTRDRTHALRACVNSNSLLLCHAVEPNWDEEDGPPSLRVDATLHQTLECIPARARTERLEELLGGQEWTGEEERPTKRIRRYTRQEISDLVQASDFELEMALDAQRVLEIDGNMRKVDNQALAKLLSSLLQTFGGNALNAESFDLSSTASLFADEADLPLAIAAKALGWFSHPTDREDHSSLHLSAIAKEIGLSLLDNWRFEAVKGNAQRDLRIPLREFEDKWRASLTEVFASQCSLKLLCGAFIYNDLPHPHLVSVPAHSLPLDPAARFAHLFSLKQKWLPEDMIPFLDPISLNEKERERWVLKYARKVKVPGGKAGGTLWVAR